MTTNTNTLTLKCKLGDELKRRTLASPPETLDELRAAVADLYQLEAPFRLCWTDEDEDEITIGTDADVAEAVRCTMLSPKPVLRLLIKTEPATPAATPRASNCTVGAPDFEQMMRKMQAQLVPGLEKMAADIEKRIPELEAHMRSHLADLPIAADLKNAACGFIKKMSKKGKKGGRKDKHHMKFVADVSLPDGVELLPGEVISKTWRVVNNGSESWPADARLQHVGSDLFEGAEPSAIPSLAPGEEAELSLTSMVTPTEPGRYMSYWRLSTADGQKFGDRLWFDVTVLDASGSPRPPPPAVHLGIICDATGVTPLVGNRFKKLGHDYDLCQEAFDALSDDEKAAFVLIRTPEDAARVRELESAAQLQKTEWADKAFQLRGMQEDYDRVMAQPLEARPAEFAAIDLELKEKLQMKFVADVSLPDGVELLPGEAISKTWRVVNNGSESWPADARLQHFMASELEGSEPSAIPSLAPGEEAELSLTSMVTPTEPGRYMSYWRLSTADGHMFGDQLWFDITVIAAPAAEPEQPQAVLDCTDLSSSCIADIEANFHHEAEAAETARVEAEAAETARLEAEAAEAARVEAAAEAARLEAEAAEAAKPAELARSDGGIPAEWRSAVDALVQMGFSSMVAQEKVMAAEGNLEAALEAALSYVPPPPPADALVNSTPSEPVEPTPADALVNSTASEPKEAWENDWDYLLEELAEMGFEDVQANKSAVAQNNGDLKSTVTALVSAERAKRNKPA